MYAIAAAITYFYYYFLSLFHFISHIFHVWPSVCAMNEFGPDGWKVLVDFFLLLSFLFGFLLNIIYVCRF